MAVINPPGYLHNLATHTAQVDRIAAIASGIMPDGAGLTFRPGVRGIGDLKVAAQGSPNMTVAVAAGLALVKGSLNAFQGLYSVPNDGSTNVTISASNPTLPRNDLIIVRVQDSFYSGATNTATIEVVTGTAAASPSDPALPANSLLLARVRVLANATSIVNGQIDDLRQWTAGVGGVIPCLSTARPNIAEATMIYEIDTDRLRVSDGTGWNYVAGTAPEVIARQTAAQSIPNNTFTSVTFDTEDEDTDGIFTAGGSAFTINTPGLYLIKAQVSFVGSTGGAYRAVQLTKNGTAIPSSATYMANNQGTAVIISVPITFVVRLVATDVIRVQAQHVAGVAINTNTALDALSHMHIVRLAA